MGANQPELRFVEFIPHSERHGHPASQFPLWFSVNMMLLTTLTGGIGVLAGLNLFWSIVAIVVGNLVGAVFVAAHSVQGPRLGIPQMIQSRAQFGYFGAVIPLIAVLIMYLGYFASNAVIAGDAFAAGTPIDQSWGIIISGIIILVITFYGHDLIHRLERWFAIALAIGFLIITIAALQVGVPSGSMNPGEFNLGAFLMLTAATATWQLTFAPYVADYSRYLPANTSSAATFVYTYAGLAIATVWLMSLGALLVTLFPEYGDTPSETIAALFDPAWAPAIYIFIVLGVIATNVVDLYGAFMSLTTILDSLFDLRPSVGVRAIIMTVVFAAGTGIALLATADFMTFFSNLLLILSYLLFPWTSINLADFYFVRKGRYLVKDIFNPNGIYGRFNGRALLVYFVTILLELPFMGTAFFEGPVFTALGGIDLAWIIALVVPGILYLIVMRDVTRSSESLETDTLDVAGIQESIRAHEHDHL